MQLKILRESDYKISGKGSNQDVRLEMLNGYRGIYAVGLIP